MIILVWIFLLLMLSTVYAYRTTNAPLVFSPKKGLESALEFINPQRGAVFFDLGCGSGKTLIVAEKKFGLRSTGFDLATTSYLLSKINLFLHKTKNANIVFKNLYNVSLGEADIVFCFLNIGAMEKLEKKFEKELKPGSWLISYCFSLKNKEPIRIIELKGEHKFHLYQYL